MDWALTFWRAHALVATYKMGVHSRLIFTTHWHRSPLLVC